MRLLAECVYAAKFIAEGQAKRLVNVICDFVSEEQASRMYCCVALEEMRLNLLCDSGLPICAWSQIPLHTAPLPPHSQSFPLRIPECYVCFLLLLFAAVARKYPHKKQFLFSLSLMGVAYHKVMQHALFLSLLYHSLCVIAGDFILQRLAFGKTQHIFQLPQGAVHLRRFLGIHLRHRHEAVRLQCFDHFVLTDDGASGGIDKYCPVL